MNVLQPIAILKGVLAAAVLAVPAGVVAAIIDDESAWNLPLFVAVLVGFYMGGLTAARAAPDAPLANAAVAALSLFVVVQAVGVIRRAIVDEEIPWASIAFFAMVATTAGLLGGLRASVRFGSEERA